MTHAVKFGEAFNGFEPGRMTVVEADRDGVEEESGGGFGPGACRTSVGDQSGRDIRLARKPLQSNAMRGEQHRFHRQSVRLCKLLGGALQFFRNHDRRDGISDHRRFTYETGFQRRRAGHRHGATPEFPRSGILECLPFQTDLLGEDGRRVNIGVDRRHVDAHAEQIVLKQFADQIRDTPAVQNRVMKRENQVHTLIPDKRAHTVERSATEVVAARVLGRYIVPDKRIVGSGHHVERSRHA